MTPNLSEQLALASQIVRDGLEWEWRYPADHPNCKWSPSTDDITITMCLDQGYTLRLKPSPAPQAVEWVPAFKLGQKVRDKNNHKFTGYVIGFLSKRVVRVGDTADATHGSLFEEDELEPIPTPESKPTEGAASAGEAAYFAGRDKRTGSWEYYLFNGGGFEDLAQAAIEWYKAHSGGISAVHEAMLKATRAKRDDKSSVRMLCEEWALDHTLLQKFCREAGCTEFDVEGGSYGVPGIEELVNSLRDAWKSRAEKAEARTAELEQEARKMHAMYLNVVRVALDCDPIPACNRPDNQMEPPWEVFSRVKRERDAERAEHAKTREEMKEEMVKFMSEVDKNEVLRCEMKELRSQLAALAEWVPVEVRPMASIPRPFLWHNLPTGMVGVWRDGYEGDPVATHTAPCPKLPCSEVEKAVEWRAEREAYAQGKLIERRQYHNYNSVWSDWEPSGGKPDWDDAMSEFRIATCKPWQDDKWAECKAAFARGEKIEYRRYVTDHGTGGWSTWWSWNPEKDMATVWDKEAYEFRIAPPASH